MTDSINVSEIDNAIDDIVDIVKNKIAKYVTAYLMQNGKILVEGWNKLPPYKNRILLSVEGNEIYIPKTNLLFLADVDEESKRNENVTDNEIIYPIIIGYDLCDSLGQLGIDVYEDE